MTTAPYDAIIVYSFGGPEGPDDVLPFLRNVTRGRNVPDDRLAEVGEQYDLFGGVSPINQQNRALIDALVPELAAAGIDLPVYFGNRNWHPFLADTLDEIVAAGHRRILALVTSAFGSYSGCRQYRTDLETAAEAAAVEGLSIDKIRVYWNHPGFLDASADRLRTALADHIDAEGLRLVFTAHSIPTAWTPVSPYVDQLTAAAEHLATSVAPGAAWDLVYQSRSGPPQVPWLEPDIVDHLEAIAPTQHGPVAVFPLGFVSDHMEVMFDLDTQAAEAAADLGLTMIRVPTVGTHPAFVGALRSLIAERVSGADPLAAIGEPWPCPEGCCAIGAGGRPGRPT